MNRIYGRFLCIVLLLAFFTLAAENARKASITVDEGLHIASGYTILVTGDYRLVEEHPPLIKLWMALPLLPLSDMADPTTLSAWDTSKYAISESVPLLKMAQQLLYVHLPVEQWLLPARFMCIYLGILTLSLLFRWTTELWGIPGSLLVIALAAFDPNIIAYSAVAGTDIGAAFFILLSLWLGSKFIRTPNKRFTLLTGLTLGLALTTKLTAVLVIIPMGLTGLFKYLRGSKMTRGPYVRSIIILIIVTFLTMWCIYSFQIGKITGIPVPLPMPAHATPFLRLLQHAGEGHQAYLFGENKLDGWWYYFPLAYLVKTPIPVLLLFPLAIIVSVRQALWSKPQSGLIVIFFLLYAATSIASSLNIGYRHIVPLLCLIYIWTGAVLIINKSWSRLLCYSLLVYQVFSTLYASPYHLGWFNAISGGVKNGWRYLADSNTDWGQGYKALSSYQNDQNIPTMRLAGFVFYDPAIYELDYTPLPPLHGDTPAIFPNRFAPPPGHYAISLTSLDGIPLADNEMYDWFRWQQPTQRIANAIHYYRVTTEDVAADWVAQCSKPAESLSRDVIEEGFGVNETRRIITFDCTQSWIFPHDNEGNGVYVIHGSHLENNLATKLHYTQPQAYDYFIDSHLKNTEISYLQIQYRDNPAFGLFRQLFAQHTTEPENTTLLIGNAESPPLRSSNQVQVKAPIAYDGPLDFMGLSANRANHILEIETWWQVKEDHEIEGAFSIMAHILNADGENLDVADGLGINPDQWSPGDIIIQRHQFTLDPSSSADRTLFRTGLYWLESGERMQLKGSNSYDALFFYIDE